MEEVREFRWRAHTFFLPKAMNKKAPPRREVKGKEGEISQLLLLLPPPPPPPPHGLPLPFGFFVFFFTTT